MSNVETLAAIMRAAVCRSVCKSANSAGVKEERLGNIKSNCNQVAGFGVMGLLCLGAAIGVSGGSTEALVWGGLALLSLCRAREASNDAQRELAFALQ